MEKIEYILQHTRKIRLLYVEDNKDARDSTLSVLEEFFADIVVATDGEEGVAKFQEGSFDLVITDINMLHMDGLTMLKELYRYKHDLLTIVLSAYNESDYYAQSIKLGVDGYLLKPLDFEQLLSVLYKVSKQLDVVKENAILQQYKEIADESSIFTIIDKDNRIRYANDAFCKLSGFSKEELLGQLYFDTMYCKGAECECKVMWEKVQKEKKTYKGTMKYYSKTGELYYLESTIKPVFDTEGEIVEYIVLRHDVSEIMSPQRLLNDFIDSAQQPLVVMARIENFEDIANLYGHKQIVAMQEQFLAKLQTFLPEHDGLSNIYMLGNGEYALAADKKYLDKAVEDIVAILKTFQTRVNESSIMIGELDYDISIVLSLAYQSEPLENAKHGIDELLKSGKSFIIANALAQVEHQQAQQNIEMLKKIKIALQKGKIVSYFQPIIDNKTKEIQKYESLVRLIDEEGEVLSPFLFLDVAKRGKYYTQITSAVLDNSFAALMQTDKVISINISSIDILNEEVSRKLLTLLEEHKEDAKRIVLEILEYEASEEYTDLFEYIEKIKTYGVRIAIDDFGAGYSNFARLLRFQPDILKIDGSLIKNIADDELSLSIVRTMVSFAKEQNLEVVAEFVENEEIYNIVHTLGVEYSQGYYFAAPKPL